MHKQYAPMMYSLMKRATREEMMLNAPLWWIDPHDQNTFTIDSGQKKCAPGSEQTGVLIDVVHNKYSIIVM